MDDLEDILITPAKKLDDNQIEIVNFHKILTEFWQNSCYNKSATSLSFPFRNNEYSGFEAPVSNDDLDSELKSFLEKRDSTLIPEELLYTTKVEFYNRQLDNKSTRQKLSVKLMSMEKKESEMKTDESDHEVRKKLERESSINEPEEVVGDYKYSFCEEEDIDNENEYNF